MSWGQRLHLRLGLRARLRQLRWSGPTVTRLNDARPFGDVRAERESAQDRYPGASSGRCPPTSRGRPAPNVVMSASACTLRLDVHDNFAGQDRRSLPINDGRPSRGVRVERESAQARYPGASSGRCPPMSRSRRTPNVVMSVSVFTLGLDVHDKFVGRARLRLGAVMGHRLDALALYVSQRWHPTQALQRARPAHRQRRRSREMQRRSTHPEARALTLDTFWIRRAREVPRADPLRWR